MQVRDTQDASSRHCEDTLLYLPTRCPGPLRHEFVTHVTQVRDTVKTHDSASVVSGEDPEDASS